MDGYTEIKPWSFDKSIFSMEDRKSLNKVVLNLTVCLFAVTKLQHTMYLIPGCLKPGSHTSRN